MFKLKFQIVYFDDKFKTGEKNSNNKILIPYFFVYSINDLTSYYPFRVQNSVFAYSKKKQN